MNVTALTRQLLLAALLLTSGWLFATNLAIDPVTVQQRLDPYFSYYIDTTQQLEISDIKNDQTRYQWLPPKDERLNFGFSDAAIWLKTTIENPSDLPLNRLIELPYSLIDNVEFYQINSQGRLLANYIMGSELRFSSRPIPHHNFVIPLVLKPHSSNHIFLRLTGQHSLNAPLTLWSAEKFWKISKAENRLNFAYFTLLLALTAYAFYRLSPQPRIRRYIFPGMVVTPLMALLTIEGYAFQFIWPENPGWNSMGLATLIPGSLTFLSLYLFIIFSKMALGNRLHNALLSFGVINVLLLILPIVINYKIALALDLIASVVYVIFLAYLSIKYWRRLSRPNKVTLLGFFWLALSTLIFVLEITNIIPSFPVIEAPLQVGFFLFVFSLFWAQLNIYARAFSIFGNKKAISTIEDSENNNITLRDGTRS